MSQIQKNQGGTGSGQPERGGGSLGRNRGMGGGLEGGAISGLHPLPSPSPPKRSPENPEIGERGRDKAEPGGSRVWKLGFKAASHPFLESAISC